MDARGDPAKLAALAAEVKRLGAALGFQQVGITGTATGADGAHLQRWIERGLHGEMAYLAAHGTKRTRPAELVPGTVRVISARMNYFPRAAQPAGAVLADPARAYIARYALGRDYHKLMRKRLARLAAMLAARCGPLGYRVFSDSAPVLERALARNAGLGWIGKHTNLIHRDAGSWFFLGEIYTDLPLPLDPPHAGDYCGRCRKCIDVCPTAAIIAPYELDARRCIAYLTIELKGPIPEQYRALIGNRIFGCDDCQLVCPWNRHAGRAFEPAFEARHGLDGDSLVRLFRWTPAEFLHYTEGSALRRIAYPQWLRNVAVALGNGPASAAAVAALAARADDPDECVREHVRWALARLHRPAGAHRAAPIHRQQRPVVEKS